MIPWQLFCVRILDGRLGGCRLYSRVAMSMLRKIDGTDKAAEWDIGACMLTRINSHLHLKAKQSPFLLRGRRTEHPHEHGLDVFNVLLSCL